MTAKGLREELDRERQSRDEAMKIAEAAAEERMKQMQRDHNQELLAINNLFGRKEQQYKEVIEKLVNGLNSAQRIQQSSQTKLQAATRCLQKVAEDKRSQQSIARGIKEIIEEIQLRQDNSKISDKSDEMSIDEIEISGKKMDHHHMVEDSERYEDAAYTPV
jgi:ATP-dependent protease Clp ATPase subunit